MNNSRTLAEDDDDDTMLFERLQQHALEHCPNPQRIGCPPRHVLEAFVAQPAMISPAQLNDLHVMQCAECTRELLEFQRIREKGLLERDVSPKAKTWWGWTRIGFAIAAGILIIVGAVLWRERGSGAGISPESAIAFSTTVDLSNDGRSRDLSNSPARSPITLPRRKIDLHLVLPYFSPAGNYQVAVARERRMDSAEVSQKGLAAATGPHTELTVFLDLHRMAPGTYYLGITAETEGVPNFYPLKLD